MLNFVKCLGVINDTNVQRVMQCLHIGEVKLVVVVPDKGNSLCVHSFTSAETLPKQIE